MSNTKMLCKTWERCVCSLKLKINIKHIFYEPSFFASFIHPLVQCCINSICFFIILLIGPTGEQAACVSIKLQEKGIKMWLERLKNHINRVNICSTLNLWVGVLRPCKHKSPSNKYKRKSIHRHLIIICVVQIFIIIILVLFHLVPNRPLPWGSMSVIHRIVGITSRTDIRSGGETSGAKEKQFMQKLHT